MVNEIVGFGGFLIDLFLVILSELAIKNVIIIKTLQNFICEHTADSDNCTKVILKNQQLINYNRSAMAIGVCPKGVEVGEVARTIATTQFKIEPLQCNWILSNENKS